MDNLPHILFVSHKKARCGVYEFGRAISDALKVSRKYDFERVECGDAGEFHAAVKQHRPAAIIYNHHQSTLPWVDRTVIRRYRGPHLGILHEVTQEVADAADGRLFDFHIAADPTLLLRNPIVFKTGRLVPRFDKTVPAPTLPTIGSFGFATHGKGFETLVRTVQDQFDRAAIRLHIPSATFGDANGDAARIIARRCRDLLTKPGIDLQVGHDFLSNDDLLGFLAGNSLNAFLYEQQNGRGISSVVDFALAVGRPIAVTRSSMFRHVRDTFPPVTIEDASLPDILARGFAPVARYAREWTAENLVWDYERILTEVFAARGQGEDDALTSFARAFTHTKLADRTGAALGKIGGAVARATSPVLQEARQRIVGSRGGGALLAALRAQPGVMKTVRSLRARANRAAAARRPATSDWVPTSKPSDPATTRRGAVEPYQPLPGKLPLNRILDLQAYELYTPAIEYMFRHVPHLMARKIPRANVQQAFVLDTVLRLVAGRKDPKLICIGSFEDTASAGVTLSGHVVEEVDPVVNYDLGKFMTKPSTRRAYYDVVFSTSVIEHVANDQDFLVNMEELLAPGGFGVLTCDFNDKYAAGDPLPVEDCRFYTTRDFTHRLLPLLSRSELVDAPDWRCEEPDFSYGGCRYTFATLVFRRLR